MTPEMGRRGFLGLWAGLLTLVAPRRSAAQPRSEGGGAVNSRATIPPYRYHPPVEFCTGCASLCTTTYDRDALAASVTAVDVQQNVTTTVYEY
jgi:hypothetical protein